MAVSGHTDLIVTNARITTLDEGRPEASALVDRPEKKIARLQSGEK